MRHGKAVAPVFTRVACLLLAAALPLPAQESTVAEYRSKANFLATFPSFVDWPDSVFSSEQSPVVICVRGDFSFGTSLAELARNSSPHGRRVEVRWVHKDVELHSCQILFVSRSEAKRYAKVLQSVGGTGVLTVGETPDFLAAGGIISFALENESLQFEVNLLAADTAKLKISSRLLALAKRIVHRSEGAKS
jgi:YfiR/HmsC-like